MSPRNLINAGLIFALTVATSAPLLAQAEPGWIGKRVVQRKGQFTLLVNAEVVDQSGKGLAIYRVEQVDGPSLLLREEGQRSSGWAASDDVVLLEKALDFFTKQIHANPKDAFFRAARAFLWCDRSEFDKSVNDYDEAIKLDSKTAAHFRGRGMALHFKKSYEQAIADFDKAIRLDPRSAPTFVSRGASRSARNEYGKAIADYSEAIWLDPLAITAYKDRGLAWWSKKEFGKAIVDYNLAIRLDPEQTDAYCDRGDAWIALKKFDRADADFKRAIQLDEKCARAHGGRATIWSTCPDAAYRNAQKAIASATRACELTTWQEAQWLNVLAASYAEAGDFTSAIIWQTKANMLDHDGPELSRGQARLKLYHDRKPIRDPDA